MVSSWTESEWDQESRDLILAEDRVRRLTGQYGEWLPDATSDAASPNEDSGWGYLADGPFTNWAKFTVDKAEEDWRANQGEKPDLRGKYWTVVRKDWTPPSP